MAKKPEASFTITAEDKTAAAIRQAEKNLKTVAGNVATFATASVAAFAAIGAGVARLADHLDNLARVAKRGGVGVEVYQQWEYAATQAGASAGEFASAMARANTAIGQAAAGTGPAVKIFDALGISARDASGNVRGTEEIVREFADKLAKLRSPAEQAAAAAALFGRGAGPSMAAALREGNAGLRQYEESLRAAGGVVTAQAVQAADDFNDRMDTLRRILTASLANQIFQNAQGLEDLATAIGKVAGVAAGAIADVASFARWVGEELAARIHGVADNDLPRLTGALFDAERNLRGLQGAAKNGVLGYNNGKSPAQQIADAAAEVDRLTAAVKRAREMAANGQGMGQLVPPLRAPENPAAGGTGELALGPEIPKGAEAAARAHFEKLLAEEARYLETERQMRIEQAQQLEQEIADEQDRLRAERLAEELGFASAAEAERAAFAEEVWQAGLERKRAQWEEELALELGYKSAHDQAIQEAEEAHQEALIRARYRGNELAQRAMLALHKFEKAQGAGKTKVLLDQAAQLTAGMASNSKTLFNINKALSLASAIMNTAEGVTKALSHENFAGAALIAAMGAAQIATIASTQFGGGGSGYTGGGPGSGIPSMAASDMFKAPEVTAEERNRTTIRLEVVGGDDVTRAIVRNARVIVDAEDDVFASRNSRQALEFSGV